MRKQGWGVSVHQRDVRTVRVGLVLLGIATFFLAKGAQANTADLFLDTAMPVMFLISGILSVLCGLFFLKMELVRVSAVIIPAVNFWRFVITIFDEQRPHVQSNFTLRLGVWGSMAVLSTLLWVQFLVPLSTALRNRVANEE